MRNRWPLPVPAFAHRPVAENRPVQQLDETVGNLSSAVEPLVDDQPFLGLLCHELAHQLVLCVDPGAADLPGPVQYRVRALDASVLGRPAPTTGGT